MTQARSILHRTTIPDWPRKRRALRHLALCVPPLWLSLALYSYGMAERHAAEHGDHAVLAARAAVRAFFHHRDATSVLEHAVTGVGYALVGLFVLQIYYFIDEWPGATDVPVALWLRVLGSIGVSGPIAATAWTVAYPGHGPYAALVAMVAVCAVLNCERHVRWLARATPGRFIGLAGGLMWANFDLAWKVYRWSATHDSANVVLTQLVASLVSLIVCSAVISGLLRRVHWLRTSTG